MRWLKDEAGPDRLVAAGSAGAALALILFGLAHEPDPLAGARRILRLKLNKARTHRSARRDREFSSESFEGYVEKQRDRLTYVIRVKDFRAWFAKDSGSFKLVLEWLESRGCLLARRSRTPGQARPTDWAEKRVIWPDGKAVRSLEFTDPFAD